MIDFAGIKKYQSGNKEHNMPDPNNIENNEMDEGLLDNPLLAILNDEEPKEEADEFADAGDAGETVEVLRERVHARNQQLRQNKKAIERMQAQIDELSKKSQSVSPEMIAALMQKPQEKQVSEEEQLDQLLESAGDDPKAIMKIMLQREKVLEGKLVNVLRNRDAQIEQRLKPKPDEATSKTIDKLRTLPQFAGFSDDQLETVSKLVIPAARAASRPPAQAGGRPYRVSGRAPSDEDLMKQYEEELNEMGFGK
jgi:hypothetical protein